MESDWRHRARAIRFRIWDTETAQEINRLYFEGEPSRIRAVAFSRDEKELWAVQENWSLYRISLPLEDLNAEALRLVVASKSEITDQDCEQYLHQKPCPA